MTQPDLSNMRTTECELCHHALLVDEYIIPKIILTKQRIATESAIKVKGDPGWRAIIVASIVQAVHFDCLVAQRMFDAGLIERKDNDAGTPDTPGTEAVPTDASKTERRTTVVDDRADQSTDRD